MPPRGLGPGMGRPGHESFMARPPAIFTTDGGSDPAQTAARMSTTNTSVSLSSMYGGARPGPRTRGSAGRPAALCCRPRGRRSRLPARDDLAGAEHERLGEPALPGRVEDLAVAPHDAGVLHDHGVPAEDRRPVAAESMTRTSLAGGVAARHGDHGPRAPQRDARQRPGRR